MEAWWQDTRYAVRSLRKQPGFALVVVVTLALGLGANTAVFSVYNAVLLEALPYPAPDRLVRLYHADAQNPADQNYLAGPEFVDYREKTTRLAVLAAEYTYSPTGGDVTDGGAPERVPVLPVSADYFDALGIQPMLGRGFRRSEERAGAHVVVVSRGLWERHLGGDPDAVGGTLTLDGQRLTVVGVMPAGVEDPLQGRIDVWTPLDLTTPARNTWGNHYLSAIGRLRPGVTLAQARQELDAISRRRQGDLSLNRGNLVPLQKDLVGTAGSMLGMLMGSVGLLFIIACVNVASLFLARGASREHELAVRVALGSPRGRLLRQLFAESLVLGLAGGVVGLLLGRVVLRLFLAAAPARLTATGAPTLDGRLFLYGFGLAVLASLLFGTAPALRFSRPGVAAVLREGTRGGEGRRQSRVRGALVVVEVSLALVLLVGAGVLIRSFQRLQHVDLGIQPRDVLTFQINLPESRYSDPAARVRFYDDLHARLRALPGVRAVAAVSHLPVGGDYHNWGTRLADAPNQPDSWIPADQRVVQGDYFAALGIPLVRGRVFGPQDAFGTPERYVVNQELVRRLFPDSDPIGKWLRIDDGPHEIIGVVGDVPITGRGQVMPMVYHSHRQFAGDRNWALTQLVAYTGDPGGLVAAARRQLAAIDPLLVLHDVHPLEELIGRGVAQERFAMLLLSGFSAVALLLAAVGLYGLLAYVVSRRRREIGIRMALGARGRDVLRLVVGQGMALAVAGVSLGIVGALLLTRWLASLVFQISVRDPLVFMAAPATLVLVALLSCYLPARGASRVDPAETFRRET